MNNNHKGFTVVEVIIIVGVAALVAFLIWSAYTAVQKEKSNSNESALQQNNPDAETKDTGNVLKLGERITFEMPDTWSAEASDLNCQQLEMIPEIDCITSARVTPGAKLPTRYGNGTEFFYVQTSVLENPQNLTPKVWLEEKLQTGTGSGNVQVSDAKINGYDAFYRVQQYSGDGTEIKEMEYVIVSAGKAVYVKARTYEPGKLTDGTTVGDFRQFEPGIKALVKSIAIKD